MSVGERLIFPSLPVMLLATTKSQMGGHCSFTLKVRIVAILSFLFTESFHLLLGFQSELEEAFISSSFHPLLTPQLNEDDVVVDDTLAEAEVGCWEAVLHGPVLGDIGSSSPKGRSLRRLRYPAILATA